MPQSRAGRRGLKLTPARRPEAGGEEVVPVATGGLVAWRAGLAWGEVHVAVGSTASEEGGDGATARAMGTGCKSGNFSRRLPSEARV